MDAVLHQMEHSQKNFLSQQTSNLMKLHQTLPYFLFFVCVS